MNSNNQPPKVTIGMPVYNGEKFLCNALDCLLAQSYTNLELIISDDASTDSTSKICTEYAAKDSRIKYIRHTKNLGIESEAGFTPLPNFNFVLNQASSPYFMWAGVDDKWEPEFIEKNVNVLEANTNFVASTSKMSWQGNIVSRKHSSHHKRTKFKNLLKFRKTYDVFDNYEHVFPVSGSYEEKVVPYLRHNTGSAIFALYRTDKLQKCIVQKPFAGWDLVIVLKALRFGDINVLDEKLMERYAGGASSKSILIDIKADHGGLLRSLFLYMPLTIWCLKNLGSKIFFKNLDWFFVLNGYGLSMILPEIPMFLRYLFLKQKPNK